MAPVRLVGTKLVLPLALHSVCAGFPSPADDYLDDNIDLTRLLIVNPPATFLWRVEGIPRLIEMAKKWLPSHEKSIRLEPS